MLNVIAGVITILVSVILIIFAFHSSIFNAEKKYISSLVLIVLAGLLLRVFVAADGFLHEWDEKYHALVSKNLIENPLKPTLYKKTPLPYDHKNWVGNHVWLEKGPIPLWSMALSMRIFGKNVYALRLPSLDLSLVSIILTFLIGQLMFNSRTGLIASAFHASHGLLIELSGGRISSDHVETFFIFFIQLAIYFALYHAKKTDKLWPVILVGLSTALAILSKWFPALLVFPVWLICWLIYHPKKWKTGFLFITFGFLITTIITAPFFIFIYYSFPEETIHIFEKFLGAYSQTVEDHHGPWYFYIHKMGMLFGEIIYIPLGIALYSCVKSTCKKPIIILLTWILIPVVVFSFAETKRITYLMIAAPAFFILTAYYLQYFMELFRSKKSGWFYGLVMVLLILLPVRYSVERVKPFQKLNRNPEWVSSLKNIELAETDEKTIYFNIEKYIDLMFYKNCIAYPRIPDESEINELLSEGYHIIIHDSGSLPRYIYLSDKISIKKLY